MMRSDVATSFKIFHLTMAGVFASLTTARTGDQPVSSANAQTKAEKVADDAAGD
jgi:hypothetical protein